MLNIRVQGSHECIGILLDPVHVRPCYIVSHCAMQQGQWTLWEIFYAPNLTSGPAKEFFVHIRCRAHTILREGDDDQVRPLCWFGSFPPNTERRNIVTNSETHQQELTNTFPGFGRDFNIDVIAPFHSSDSDANVRTTPVTFINLIIGHKIRQYVKYNCQILSANVCEAPSVARL